MHMEHLNKIAKGAISFLGSNKSEKAIARIGQSIGTLSPVLDNLDEEKSHSKHIKHTKETNNSEGHCGSCERASQSRQSQDKKYQERAFTFPLPKRQSKSERQG